VLPHYATQYSGRRKGLDMPLSACWYADWTTSRPEIAMRVHHTGEKKSTKILPGQWGRNLDK